MNILRFMAGISVMSLLFSCGQRETHHEDAHEESTHGHTDEIVIHADKAEAAGIVAELVSKGKFREIIQTSGEILPAAGDESTVIAPMDGIVSFSRNFTEGAAVSEDMEMFVIGSGTLQDGNRIEKARIAYETAKEEYERASKLTGSRIVSQKEFAVIRENYENARLTYEALKPSENGKGAAVTAPFDGYVKSLSVSNGDYVAMGTPLATVTRNADLILEADLSQKDFAKRNSIAAANFRTSYSDRTYSTDRLVSIGKSRNEGEYYMPVSFSVRNTGDIVSGSFAEIWLLCEERTGVITVPVSALTEEQGLYFVYLKLDEECYRKQEVAVGASDGIRVEIISGLHEGDNVVTHGAYNVKLASASNAIPAHTHNH